MMKQTVRSDHPTTSPTSDASYDAPVPALPASRRFTLEEWSHFPPFPGHRNSEARAKRAVHLHTLLPEHLVVEGARLVDEHGVPILKDNKEQIFRWTGNTRVHVWQNGLSDRVPESVSATVYDCQWHDLNTRGMRFDSPQAVWSANDHTHRALGTTFVDGWRPRSRALQTKMIAFASGCRRAQFIISRQSGAIATVQYNYAILPLWRKEIQILDEIFAGELSPNVGLDAANVAIVTAYFLLLRCELIDQVSRFIGAILEDSGIKDDLGYDGVQIAIDTVAKREKTNNYNFSTTAKIVASFLLWKTQRRVKSKDIRSPNLFSYCETAMRSKG